MKYSLWHARANAKRKLDCIKLRQKMDQPQLSFNIQPIFRE